MTGCVIWGDVLNEGIWFMMELVLEVDVVYEGMWYMRGCGIWWDVVYEGMWYMRGCCIRGGNPRTFVPKMSEIKTLLLSNCRAKMTTQWLQCWRTLQISTVITRCEDYSCDGEIFLHNFCSGDQAVDRSWPGLHPSYSHHAEGESEIRMLKGSLDDSMLLVENAKLLLSCPEQLNS